MSVANRAGVDVVARDLNHTTIAPSMVAGHGLRSVGSVESLCVGCIMCVVYRGLGRTSMTNVMRVRRDQMGRSAADQNAATVREFEEALRDGHMEMVWKIYRANPDLRDAFEQKLGHPLGD